MVEPVSNAPEASQQTANAQPRRTTVWGGKVPRSLKSNWWPEGVLEATVDNRLRFYIQNPDTKAQQQVFDVSFDEVSSFVTQLDKIMGIPRVDITLANGDKYELAFTKPLSKERFAQLATSTGASALRADGMVGYAVGEKILESREATTPAEAEMYWWKDLLANSVPEGTTQANNIPRVKLWLHIVGYIGILIACGIANLMMKDIDTTMRLIAFGVMMLIPVWMFNTQAGRAALYQSSGEAAFRRSPGQDGKAWVVNKELAAKLAPDMSTGNVLKWTLILGVVMIGGLVLIGVGIAIVSIISGK